MSHSSGIWLIYVLTIEGSYQHNIERPATAAPDTMQYWISESEAWDIRSFAIDKELRILQLDISTFKGELLSYLDETAHNIYKGIIKNNYRIHVLGADTNRNLVSHVSSLGLYPNAHWTELNFPLWLPEAVDYHSRSD